MEHLSRGERPFAWSAGTPVHESVWGLGGAEERAALAKVEGVVPLAERVVVPAGVEAAFYRLNQLPGQLGDVFRGLVSRDPDEDDVEDVAPEARALLARHVLDDVFVEAFYEASSQLPERVRVRRLGREGTLALRGRPALLALRAAWAEAWTDDAIVARLRETGELMPAPRAVVVHGADQPAPEAVVTQVAEALGAPPRIVTLVNGRVAQLVP